MRGRRARARGLGSYVPLSNIVSIIVSKFLILMSKSLALAAGVFGQVTHYEATRIAPLLKSMNTQYTGPGPSGATIDGLAEQSMPLCMRQLRDGLKKDHELKHQGRLQYGLFIKGADMMIEEHMLFFQREFSKIMTGEQFNKQYAYHIRHMHWKEGNIQYDDSNLSALLTKLNIGSAGDRDAVMQQKREGNFQLACLKHFEVMHPGAAGMKGVQFVGEVSRCQGGRGQHTNTAPFYHPHHPHSESYRNKIID